MAEVRLGGADQGRFAHARIKRLHGVEFCFVTNGGAGGVAFHVINVGGADACLRVSPFKGEDLPFGVGLEQEFAFTVVGKANAANDGVNLVAVTHGVAVTFEDKHASPFTRIQPVGALI